MTAPPTAAGRRKGTRLRSTAEPHGYLNAGAGRRTGEQATQTGGQFTAHQFRRAAALGLSDPYGPTMEAFESFVALALETEDLVVSEAQKFSFQRQTSSGLQTHGYEIDLVGARADQLVLASVKSYFGSRGVAADHLMGQAAKADLNKRYALINDEELRTAVVAAAAKRFGYPLDQVRLRLYVGRFAGSRPGESSHEQRIRDWCAKQTVGGGPIEVIDVHEVVSRVRAIAESRQYRDNAALVALKVLEAAGVLSWPKAASAAE